MKRRTMLLLVGLLSATHSFVYAHSNVDTKRIENAVLTQFDSLVKASKQLDEQAYFSHFDETKFVGLNSNGTNWNSIEDLRPLIETGFSMIERIELLEFTNVKISVIDANTAILVNEYKQQMMLKTGDKVKVSGGGTQVWSSASGKWKLVSVSASDKPLVNQ
jgi:hypothetical protein